MDQTKTFIIHLPRATARRPQVDHLLNASPYRAEVLDAVDGLALTKTQQTDCYSATPLHRPHYPFALNTGEIGCFLSHRAAWQRILDEDLDAALILEDDVQIEPAAFERSHTLAAAHIAQLGYIQFQVRQLKGGVKLLKEDEGSQIVAPEITPLRTSAQLVSHKAAQHLLDITKRFDRPIDTTLQMHWVTGIPLACVVPSGVSDRTAQTGGSTISRSQPIGQKIKREFKRTLYRRAIRNFSTR